ncbi:MAG TPA: DUF6350 family protein [Jatrophihabitans sp.]|nr:DUF6350 family protein [Jatrophihabitans sp.]
MTSDDDLPAGWLTQFRRGVFSGAGLLLLAVSACVVPAFLVWLVPGADSSPASTTVKAGALLALSAAHGGVLLDGERVTLVPLLVTALLAWLVSGQARRSASWSSVVGLTAGYGIASGLLAGWATLGATRAPAVPSALAGLAFVVLVGGLARAGDQAWDRLPARYRRIARAAGAACCGYVGAGSLLVAGSLAWHVGAVTAVQHHVAPGVAGLPVALLGIAAAPNAALAGVGYLAGPGFHLGTHTHISMLAASHGRLPSFPLLAAVPAGGPITWLGMLLAAVTAAAVGWVTVRLLRSAAAWPQRLLDLTAAAALAAGALAVLTAVAGGGIGDGALGTVGASWWQVGACGFLLVLLASSGWLAVELARPSAVTGNAARRSANRAVLRVVPGLAKADLTEQPPTSARSGGSATPSTQATPSNTPSKQATTSTQATPSRAGDEQRSRTRNAG